MQFVLRDKQQLMFRILDGFMLFFSSCSADMQFVLRDKQQLRFLILDVFLPVCYFSFFRRYAVCSER